MRLLWWKGGWRPRLAIPSLLPGQGPSCPVEPSTETAGSELSRGCLWETRLLGWPCWDLFTVFRALGLPGLGFPCTLGLADWMLSGVLNLNL